MTNSYFILKSVGVNGQVTGAVMDEEALDLALNNGTLYPSQVRTDLSTVGVITGTDMIVILPAFAVAVHQIPTETEYQV